LVAVTARHLVARLQATLDGDMHLDHLQHAGGELIALRELPLLLFEELVEVDARLRARVLYRLELLRRLFTRETNVEPVVAVEAVQIFLGQLRALDELL